MTVVDSSVSYRFLSPSPMTTTGLAIGPAKMMDGLYPGETYEFIVYVRRQRKYNSTFADCQCKSGHKL